MTRRVAITDLFGLIKTAIEKQVGASMLSLVIGGEPVPASRPRVTRFGTYYGKNYTKWMKDSWHYVSSLDSLPTDRPIIVMLEAVVTKPRTSKLSHPRADVDNYAKGPLDLITKAAKETGRGVWEDDRQIVFMGISKRFAEPGEDPGFKIYYMETTQ